MFPSKQVVHQRRQCSCCDFLHMTYTHEDTCRKFCFTGRVAEELVFDDITTGASQDIKQATKMARDMVTRYGMSENIGLICYKDDDDEVFIGRDLAHAHSYSEGIASAIDVEVKRIIDESYEKAKTIIAEHRDVLDRCAALLLEKEKITREEFEALFAA